MYHPSQVVIIADSCFGVGSLKDAPHVQISDKGGVGAVMTSDLSETLPPAGGVA